MGLRSPLVFVIGILFGFFFPKLLRAALDNDLLGIVSDCLRAEVRAHLRRGGISGAWKSWASPLAGAAICELSAAIVCFLFRGSSYNSVVTLIFLVVVMACARHFGVLAGVLGSISAAGTFAVFLFAPVGKFAVSGAAGRIALAVLVIGGIVLSCFLAADRSEKRVAAAGAAR